jgi:hypothetical protein
MTRLLFFMCAMVALLFAAPAFADEAAARAHFSKGIDLYDKKQFAGAQTEFEAAYKEKPSAGIKQNIALCLKGLTKYAEAATAFDEALDEGKDTLKPETKQAIERELAELSKIVATVQVTIAGADEKRVAETVVSIQPAGQPVHALAAGAQRRPIRLMPGMYTFSAKIPGVPPAEPKKLALISGAPTEITFGGEQAGQSTLNIHANVPEAVIKIEGVEVGKGQWQGPVAANKKLRVEVSAPNHKPLAFDMTVPANSTVDSPINLQPLGGSAPSTAGGAQPEKPRGRVYIALTGSLEGSSYRLSQAVDAPTASGLRKAYGGGSLGGRVGFLLSKLFAIEGFVEVGVAGTTLDPSAVSGGNKVKSTIAHWMVMPMLRFQTPGKVRFVAGTGVGVHGISMKQEEQLTSSNAIGGTNVSTGKTTDAAGIAFAWLVDAGAQFDLGPLFLEAALFLNLHGVGPVEEDASKRRALLASPAVRSGLRVGLGIPF